MDDTASSVLDGVYDRFRGTGPEWGEDRLTNHGPMAAEVLVRRGRLDEVNGWVDAYSRRLDPIPGPGDPITAENWRSALGDGRRLGDWTVYFEREMAERPWREVLALWWPRLLPGILAGATHGVIRVGHAVRSLAAGVDGPPAVAELAHALAFWAARSLPAPGFTVPAGTLDPAAALDHVERIPDQSGPVAARLGRLGEMPGWPRSLAALRAPADPDDARALLSDLVTAATVRYLPYGHASPVLLVHTATAPNQVLHVLPELPRELWAPSLAAVWMSSAMLVSTFAPADPAPREALPDAPQAADPAEEVLSMAVDNGDEHVIKFTDTAVDVWTRTGRRDALAAAVRINTLVGPAS